MNDLRAATKGVREGSEVVIDERDLEGPSSFSFFPDGSILVVDECAHQLKIFSPEGKLKKTFGGKGESRKQLSYPSDAAILKDRIIVADRFNHRLKAFDLSGDFLWEAGGYGEGQNNFIEPFGICRVNDSLVAVTDCGNARVAVYDESGRWQRSFGTKGIGKDYYESPSFKNKRSFGLWAGAVCRFRSIESCFFEDGYTMGELDAPKGIAVMPPFYFVCDYSGRIQVFNEAGVPVKTYSSLGGTGDVLFSYALWAQREKDIFLFSRELGNAVYGIEETGKASVYFESSEHFIECFRLRAPYLYFMSPWERKLFRAKIK